VTKLLNFKDGLSLPTHHAVNLLRKLCLSAVVFIFGICGLVWAEDGVAPQSIRIGMTSPLTGPNGAYGITMRDTIEVYFKKVNESGGINGRQLKLECLDDGYETDRAVANTHALIHDKKVFALIASYGSSPTTEAMNKEFGPAKVPLVGTISGADSLRGPISKNPNLRYMFNVRASYKAETQAIVTQLASLGLSNIAIVYQDDGFGLSGFDGVKAAMAKVNLQPSAVASVPRNSVDLRAAVETISKVHPQAVILVTLFKPTAEFVRGIKKEGQHPQLIALSPVGADQLMSELGEGARGIGISQVMPYPWGARLKIIRDYQQMMNKKESDFSYYGVEAFVMAKLMSEAIRQAGKNPTREELVSALENMSNLDIDGFSINLNPREHTGSSFVEISVIGDGGRVLR
jgi:ABC-type branched-subunit amino acid transport system substrate-binding protein